MANKKISQLNKVDGAVGITSQNLFPIASGVVGTYQTASVTAVDVASYCLSPMPVDYFPGNSPIGFTGTADINFHKTNWVDSSAAVPSTHAFLMVNRTNGQLTTGSGIASTVGGDNMGDCVATQDVFMQGYDITGANLVGLGSVYGNGTDRSRIFTDLANYGNELTVIGYTDLTLSGNDHVHISGQALSLENGDTQTPISGNVIITGGNVEIDPANKLIVNQISGYALGADNALLTLEGASTHVPFSNGSTEVDWSNSNIQYKTHSDGTSLNYDFSQVADGQTLTLYFQNTHNSTAITPKFRSGVFGPDTAGAVRWGAEYSNEAPAIAANKTNLYTFVRMNTGIFASAVTGYVY